MNILSWLFAGAVLGWLASIVMGRRSQARLLNVIVGMAGAVLAGYLLPPVFGVSPTINSGLSLPALVIAVGGAVVLLAALNFLLRENNVKRDLIEEKWDLVRSRMHVRWDRLTEEDIARINGDHSQLSQTLQERYGFDAKDAEDQIQRYLKSVPGIT